MKKTFKHNRDGMILVDVDGNNVEVSKSAVTRKELYFYYNQKYFNKFLNKFKFEGLTYQQINYIMRKFWNDGTIGAFIRQDWDIIKNDKFYKKHPEEQIVFAPWTMNDRYNIYDFPIELRFINTRAVSFIPVTPFRIDEDAVIGYIQRNKKSVFSSIKVKIAQLVDIEMTIRTNLKTQKYPWIIGVTPEDKNKIENIFDKVDEDNPYIVAGLDDLKNSKALVSEAPYTLDKLYNLKNAIDGEILTMLSVNNIGMLEKKEHAIVDEVNANNQEIEESGESFLDCLQEFFGRINDVLGYKKAKVSLNEVEDEAIEIQPNKEEDNNEDNE